MKDLILHNARVVLPGGIIHGGIVVRDSRIATVFSEPGRPNGVDSLQMFDLNGQYLAPGFIDLHIHGSAGVDIQATDGAGLRRLSPFLLEHGVTGFFPTFVPSGMAEYRAAITEIASYIREQSSRTDTAAGARIMGLHFEGPFVNERRRGALNSNHFQTYDGDPRSIEMFTAPLPVKLPRLMTLAPEIAGGGELCAALNNVGFRAFIGHSEAKLDQLDHAYSLGATHITHFPNGLEKLDHRAAGVVGWGLLRESVSVDCIADLCHVDAAMLQLILKNKGPRQMALISDAIPPTGLGDGIYDVWGARIAVQGRRTALLKGGATEMPDPESSPIAGAVVTLSDAVKNMVDIGVDLASAVHMASLVPATIAGISDQTGSIDPGKIADLIAFDDALEIKLTLTNNCLTHID